MIAIIKINKYKPGYSLYRLRSFAYELCVNFNDCWDWPVHRDSESIVCDGHDNISIVEAVLMWFLPKSIHFRCSVRHRRSYVFRYSVARKWVESSFVPGSYSSHGVSGTCPMRSQLLRTDMHQALQATRRPVRSLHVRWYRWPERMYTWLAGRDMW